jgi:hypothetical protein
MKAKKNIFILMFILMSFSAIAQNDRTEKKEQIKALKVAFITSELDLNSDEARKFWPLFNAFEARQFEIKIQRMNKMDNDYIDKLSEKEALALLAKMEDVDEDLYQNRKKFIASLKGVLPTLKIIKLKRSEERFNKRLLHQFREKMKKE